MGFVLNILFIVIGGIMVYVAINATLKKNTRENVTLKLVSASSSDKRQSMAEVCIPKAHFVANGRQIDTNRYMQLLVDGKSMRSFGINNGDVVLVKETKEDKSDIFDDTDKHPVILLKVHPENNNKIEYKLRKFVGYNQFQNIEEFKQWNVKQKPNLKYKESEIEDKIRKSNESNKNKTLVISQTMAKRQLEKERIPYCSVHFADDVVGVVHFRIPAEKVKVLRRI